MFREIIEAGIRICGPEETKISARLPIFYNPVMKLNRDTTIALLSSLENKDMQACDLLAGTGIRSVRFLAELPAGKLRSLTINDKNPQSRTIIKKNIELNSHLFRSGSCKDECPGKKRPETIVDININTSEASGLLLASTGFDFIDIDPFGTPNPFLDAACRKISRKGILAVTATDTSCLAGTFPRACRRKYWADPDRGPLKHESGIRILIRKVQLIGAQYEKALTPIYSYSKDHYMRVFFRCAKGKSRVDEILKKHNMFNGHGPMWTGDLWDKKLAKKMCDIWSEREEKNSVPADKKTSTLLRTIAEESQIVSVGFHDIHNICKRNKFEVPSFERLFEKIRKAGFKISRTHFTPYGIRSDIDEKTLTGMIKECIDQNKRLADRQPTNTN